MQKRYVVELHYGGTNPSRDYFATFEEAVEYAETKMPAFPRWYKEIYVYEMVCLVARPNQIVKGE